ncbi:DUF2178 domain-containing protein [Clostridium estertheticum]|uniref:DUF2178 domain-containing protein n=1 Tax=Clostridium estertheticum TaxID=238834 RepID=UPI001CF34033|nr:DUF2178 domain-containing protein [Clostridium estertheticum]MCB2356915.1 DUF2178 domain-containing protein [Clostridium estertheticum]WAG44002.1 DUF2178 domain-containing protein [Clostridium estertheticum]
MERLAKNYVLRYYLSILEIVIGLTFVFLNKYYFNNNLIFVIGVGSIIAGVITYLPNRNTYKNNNGKKQFEQTHDERFFEISQKSSELAINIIFVLIGISALITYVYPIESYKLCIIIILAIFITNYACYTYYRHKYDDTEEIEEGTIANVSGDLTIRKFLSIFSIGIVVIGTLLAVTIGNVYLGSFFMKQIGITNILYFKIIDSIITLAFLVVGNYSSKINYPKLNKILRSVFGKMVLLLIILLIINPFIISMGLFK